MGLGEAQQLQEFTALAEEPSSVANAHIVQVTTTYKFHSGKCPTSLGSAGFCTYMHIIIYRYILLKNK